LRLVGLTGGIGSGKSTVAEMLRERGAEVIDADVLAREVVERGTEGFDEVVELFGDEVVTDEGRLDRGRIAELVFEDGAAREDLNAIVHPRVRSRIAERLGEIHGREQAAEGPEPVVVLDIPLLAEGGDTEGYAAIVVVTAPEELRVQRLVEERGMDPEDVRARIAAQASDAEREAVATHVVRNDGDLDALQRRVEEVWSDLAAEEVGR
jgi:dephospho-CoA kinase